MKRFKSYIDLLRKYNTLELKYETLRTQIKEECFKQLLNTLNEQSQVKRLKEENKKLRLKIKELKTAIK